MGLKDTMTEKYDRASELKAFDETKTGVKGLLEAGITKIPRIFHNPLVMETTAKPSSTVTFPTIDLGGGVFESKAMRESVIEKVKDAVENFGFFYAVNHGIPLDVMEKMKDGNRKFHEQDPEVRKMFYSRDKTKSVRYNSNTDLHESPAASWRDTLITSMAPDVPKAEELPKICGEVLLEYSKQVLKLAELIFELLSEALGLSPNHLKEMDCAKGLVILNHYYPPCPEPDRTFGGAPHTDRSFITILLQDHIEGFQVFRDGYWIDVAPNPNALLINVGDLLQLMSNDKFPSVEHRILANRHKEPRVSIASFLVLPYSSSKTYGPIKELLSEQNPPKYRETTANLANHYVARQPDLGNASLFHLRI